MTFPNSPLHKYLKQSFNFSFVKLHNADGGQMIKGMNAVVTEKLETNTSNQPSFIFQGDQFLIILECKKLNILVRKLLHRK